MTPQLLHSHTARKGEEKEMEKLEDDALSEARWLLSGLRQSTCSCLPGQEQPMKLKKSLKREQADSYCYCKKCILEITGWEELYTWIIVYHSVASRHALLSEVQRWRRGGGKSDEECAGIDKESMLFKVILKRWFRFWWYNSLQMRKHVIIYRSPHWAPNQGLSNEKGTLFQLWMQKMYWNCTHQVIMLCFLSIGLLKQRWSLSKPLYDEVQHWINLMFQLIPYLRWRNAVTLSVSKL